MISRIVFILVLLAVGFLLLKSWQRKKFIQKQAQESQNSTLRTTKPTQMVRCNYCDLHIPERQAIANGGRWFCCQEHVSLMKNPN
jgi:uncharacterized protein